MGQRDNYKEDDVPGKPEEQSIACEGIGNIDSLTRGAISFGMGTTESRLTSGKNEERDMVGLGVK